MTLPEFAIEGTVIVTGASRGIGASVCAEIAGRGGRVVGIGRDVEALEATIAGLAGNGHRAIAMDVADEDRWPAAIGVATESGPLAGVVTGAAVLEPIGALDQIEPEDFARTIVINLLGTALAIRAALPALREAGGAIVTFSGGGATKPLPRYDAYAASKAALVRLTENIAAAEPKIRANSVAPGFVATSMHDATLAAGADRVGTDYLAETESQLEDGGVPPERSARLVSMLIGSLGELISGKLISAEWDPWEDAEFRERLREDPDLCTLRRIDDVFFAAKQGGEK